LQRHHGQAAQRGPGIQVQGAEEAAEHEQRQRHEADRVAAAGVDQGARAAAQHDLHGEAEHEGAQHHRHAHGRVRPGELARERGQQRDRRRRGEPNREQLGDEPPRVAGADHGPPGAREAEPQALQRRAEADPDREQQAVAQAREHGEAEDGPDRREHQEEAVEPDAWPPQPNVRSNHFLVDSHSHSTRPGTLSIGSPACDQSTTDSG
jgi:hypothetical protein